jgi:putative transposase
VGFVILDSYVRNLTGEHFWARGYAVSTVGFELEAVKKYIREQERSVLK